MDTDKFFQSKLFKGIVLGIAILIILSFVFGLGVFIGMKKADFSFRWADEYHRNFGGPRGGFFGDFMGADKDFTNGNGVFGQIIKLDDGGLTVKDRDSVEKIVLVDNKTSITYQRKNIKLSELKTGDMVVVIGNPNNNGQIQAQLIRVMPASPKDLPINNY
jgi:hypothetical protein